MPLGNVIIVSTLLSTLTQATHLGRFSHCRTCDHDDPHSCAAQDCVWSLSKATQFPCSCSCMLDKKVCFAYKRTVSHIQVEVCLIFLLLRLIFIVPFLSSCFFILLFIFLIIFMLLKTQIAFLLFLKWFFYTHFGKSSCSIRLFLMPVSSLYSFG